MVTKKRAAEKPFRQKSVQTAVPVGSLAEARKALAEASDLLREVDAVEREFALQAAPLQEALARLKKAADKKLGLRCRKAVAEAGRLEDFLEANPDDPEVAAFLAEAKGSVDALIERVFPLSVLSIKEKAFFKEAARRGLEEEFVVVERTPNLRALTSARHLETTKSFRSVVIGKRVAREIRPANSSKMLQKITNEPKSRWKVTKKPDRKKEAE